MAKKDDVKAGLENIFKKTDTGQPEPKKDLVESRGVGLRSSEWAVIDELAKLTGQTYHGVMQHAAREYIKNIPRDKNGKITLETKTVGVLPST